jgi:hypothetical protein
MKLFASLTARQRGEQVVALEDEAEVLQPEALALLVVHGPQVLAQGQHLALVRPQQAGQDRQQGGLAAAGRTHQ